MRVRVCARMSIGSCACFAMTHLHVRHGDVVNVIVNTAAAAAAAAATARFHHVVTIDVYQSR